MRGRDIKRYGYNWDNIWLINAHNGVKNSIPRVNIEDYPAVKAHLNKFWDMISKRADKGDTPYNLRNCAYMEDFSRPKIIWAELARTGNAFAIDMHSNIVSNTGYILTVSDNDHQKLLYLLSFLNSRTMLFLLDQISTRFDDNGWRWLRQFVEQLRIPFLTEKDVILPLVKSINTENKQKVSKKLNDIVAQIYGFSEEEIDYINTKFSKY